MELIKLTTIDEHILKITLHRGEQLNALSIELLNQLKQILEDVKQDTTIKALIIMGEGKGFCAGADIKQLSQLNGQSGLQFVHIGQSIFNSLENLGKPSIAAVHGFALGGGCELAMAATIRIAADNTRFGQPEIKLGVIPGFGGTQRLSRLIGKGRALEICLTGRQFTAEDALQWGLITEITTSENLLTRAIEIAKKLLLLSPIAIKNIIDVIHQGYNLPMGEALELEAMHFAMCCSTKDKQEGVKAFLEKKTTDV